VTEVNPSARRTKLWIVLAILGVVLVGAVTALALFLGNSGPNTPARTKDGVSAPDPRCRDDVTDLSDPWISNGWWAGRVDGRIQQMSSAEAMALSLAGHDMEGIWLCPPR
jgi:tellurite resistance protein TehA-like permease